MLHRHLIALATTTSLLCFGVLNARAEDATPEPAAVEGAEAPEAPDTTPAPDDDGSGETPTQPRVFGDPVVAPVRARAFGDPPPTPATASPQPEPLQELRCEQVRCTCNDGEDGRDCASVTCRCDSGPSLEPQNRDDEAYDEPAPNEDSDVALELPALLQVPVATAGFTLREHRLGFRLDAGFPFLEAAFLFRVHDRITLEIAYRSLYTVMNAAMGGLTIALWTNETQTRGLSLTARGGYGRDRIQAYDYTTFITGIDGGFAELLFSLSFRFGRHAVDIRTGVRLGWLFAPVGDEYDDWYYGAWFRDGEEGVAVTVIADVGWAMRLTPTMSLFIALGVSVYTNSDELALLPESRTGLLFDF